VKTMAQVVMTFLLNASWQIVLVAAAAAVCDWVLRGAPARYRHAVWVVALLLALIVPALSLSSYLARSPGMSNTAATRIESTPVVITTIRSLDGEEIEPAESKAPVADAATKPLHGNWFSPVRLNRNAAAALFALYVLLVLYASVRLFRAWLRTRRLVKSALLFELTEFVQVIIKNCERAINSRGTRILFSNAVAVPITVGTLRPLIILPSSFLNETDEEVLTSAIGHELVHVARRDYLANLIYEFVYLPLSFHPAAMLIRSRIRQTRELCCDERVASKLLKPDVYARSLVRLIGAVPTTRRLAADTTIGIAESDNLEVRIMSLLKMRRLSTPRKALLLISAMVLLTLPCLAATSFAFSFEINGQEPQKSEQSKQKLERRDQEQLRADLEQQVQQLKELQKQASGSQRAEIEARISEVQRALEQHAALLQQYEKQSQMPNDTAARLNEVRRNLEEHARLLELYQKQTPDLEKARETQKRLQELLDKYPENASAARELQQLLETQVQGKLQGQLRYELDQQSTKHAKVIYRVEPSYTDDAREKQITGSVVLTVTVGHDGLPQSIQVKKPLFPSLDQSAIDAARKMRFEPAMKDGQIVSEVLLVEFDFSIESKHVSAEGVGGGTGQGTGTGNARGEGTGSGGVFGARRRKEETGTQEERARRQAELVQGATISMDRAIQIATSKYPGKVLACSLGRDTDGPVFYHLVIINTDGDKRTVKYVWISAVDGTIIKTEDEVRSAAPISGGVLNGKAKVLPNPTYPEIARSARASGTVTVQITVDEQGNVIYAHAISGHPLLQDAAVAAARQAKFTPTYLQGEPVKITGQIMYTFVAQ
jgi:TonB family protein